MTQISLSETLGPGDHAMGPVASGVLSGMT